MAVNETLTSDTINMPEGDEGYEYDYMQAIGMPVEFVDATSGEFLGIKAAEAAGSKAVDASVETPFGNEFFVAPLNGLDIKNAKKVTRREPTPAKFIRNTTSPKGATDVEYSDPD